MSVCSHTRDYISDDRDVITRMVTDRIGLHSVLLPLLIIVAVIIIVVVVVIIISRVQGNSLTMSYWQNETYREDFMNERKEKERVLSLKDKLKRDLDNAQSRISSLQEQVLWGRVYGAPWKYVFDVTSVGQRSLPWPCKLSERRDFTSNASSVFLVHNLCCGKCIELIYQQVSSRLSIEFLG